MHSITFHPVLPTELPRLADMIMAFYEEHAHGGPHPMTREKINKTFQRMQTHPEQVGLDVFKSANHIIGYALLFYWWSNEYGGLLKNIDELYLLPEYRNQGIASQYFQYCFTQFESYAGLTLEVLPYNVKALQLYERLGFRPTGRTHMIRLLGRGFEGF